MFNRGELYDVGWTLSILIYYLSCYLLTKSLASLVVFILILMWATKLTTILLARLKFLEPDFRYVGIKQFFMVFSFQLISAIIFSLPAIIQTFQDQGKFTLFHSFSVVFALIFLFFNSLADVQILKFKVTNQSGFLKDNLWKISRYPNYMFEILFWLFISFSLTDSLLDLFNFLTPAYAFVILRYFSGIPLQEARRKSKFGAAYEEYSSRVPLLFPFWKT
ncbi:MAG: DUF1295 domain-containing protein [Deltaproteobacteria bacterium]|nr:DUF1295 domain-containing protein [Deltaproteobacteria bacterium]